MNKTKKLCKSLSDVLRRTVASTSRLEVSNFNVNFTSRIRFLNFSSSFRVQDPDLCRRHLFYDDLGFCGGSFCSESAEKASNATCWNCNEPPKAAPFLFCESCRSVQPFDQSVDYFQIFGLEKKYEIEDENLEVKYKDWQKKLHPDIVHSKSEKEREYAAEQSARVIEAYRTLTNSLSRAIYILRLEGVDVNEEETVLEPELLTEMQEKLMQWSNSFAEAFQIRKFDEARICVRRMTYYRRVNEEIEKKL